MLLDAGRGALVCPEDLRVTLEFMLQELDCSRLEVGLAPAPWPGWGEGQCIRLVEDRNPDWYRSLCASFPRYRRHRGDKYTDSKIKRDDVRRVIRLLLSTGSRSAMAEHILDWAREIQSGFQAGVEAAGLEVACFGC